MSTTEAAAVEICASCGIRGGDDIKLKNCNACKLVKYCGVECQRNHRSQHKRACKKRAAELKKDELLFKQPEGTHHGDCPICLLPFPIATSKETVTYSMLDCCSKVVCHSCAFANARREKKEGLPRRCPFCRTLIRAEDEAIEQNEMKRVKANDPIAVHQAGMYRYRAGDYAAALEYLEKAAKLGNIESHYQISQIYTFSHGVKQDIRKIIYHTEQAAIGGHVFARHSLGKWEESNGNIDRATKHLIIAANLGYDDSLQKLKEYYTKGVVSKEEFAAALRAHQAAVEATRSPQRDADAA